MRSFYKFLVVILIVGAGLAVAQVLLHTKPTAKRRPVTVGAPLVEVQPAGNHTETVTVSALGTVVPAREVTLTPQVSGTVVWQNPELIPGARVKKDDILVRIDERDYRYALEQARAILTQAEVALETERGQAAVARREWALIGDELETTPEGKALALREPQIKNAEANLRSARSAVKKAELNLERTTIRAPFNAVILSEHVDTGQLLSPGTAIATLAGSDAFRIEAALPVADLAWITDNGSPRGIPVTVTQTNGAHPVVRAGTVERLLSDVDPKGRMARVLITVPEPLTRNQPLLLGSLVRVEITGSTLEHVSVLPRGALREGSMAWVLTPEKTLEIRDLEVVHTRREDVIVRGLNPEEQVITSRIAAPVAGMPLKLLGAENGPRQPDGKKTAPRED